MIHATNSGFNQHPKSLNRVGVRVPVHIDSVRVSHSAMLVVRGSSALSAKQLNIWNAFVGLKLIGVDDALRHDVLANHWINAILAHVLYGLSDNLPLALHDSDNRNHAFVAAHRASTSALAPSAHVSFVYLHRRPLQFDVIVGEQRTDLLEDSPRGFVSDASLALDLLRGDAATGGTHEVHRVEPNAERSSSLLEDSSCERIDLSAAMVAAVGGASANAIVLALLLALLAVSDAIGPALLFHVFEANIIARKLVVKLLQGISQVLRDALFDFHIRLTDRAYQNTYVLSRDTYLSAFRKPEAHFRTHRNAAISRAAVHSSRVSGSWSFLATSSLTCPERSRRAARISNRHTHGKLEHDASCTK